MSEEDPAPAGTPWHRQAVTVGKGRLAALVLSAGLLLALIALLIAGIVFAVLKEPPIRLILAIGFLLVALAALRLALDLRRLFRARSRLRRRAQPSSAEQDIKRPPRDVHEVAQVQGGTPLNGEA